MGLEHGIHSWRRWGDSVNPRTGASSIAKPYAIGIIFYQPFQETY